MGLNPQGSIFTDRVHDTLALIVQYILECLPSPQPR